MSGKACTVLACAAIIIMSTGAAAAQPDMCEPLKDATPGLYGLCVAVCDAHGCEPDFTAMDPFADCLPADARLVSLYESMRNPGDPALPCLSEGPCPCFTADQADAVPTPYQFCTIDFKFAEDELTTNIIHVQGTGAQSTVGSASGESSCAFGDAITDPLNPVFVFLEISTEQAVVCRQIVVDTIDANVSQCVNLSICDPECPVGVCEADCPTP